MVLTSIKKNVGNKSRRWPKDLLILQKHFLNIQNYTPLKLFIFHAPLIVIGKCFLRKKKNKGKAKSKYI